MDKIGDKLTGAFETPASSRRQTGASKKLKKFYDKQNSASSRFKSLMSFLEKAPDDELSKFFAEVCFIFIFIFIYLFIFIFIYFFIFVFYFFLFSCFFFFFFFFF